MKPIFAGGEQTRRHTVASALLDAAAAEHAGGATVGEQSQRHARRALFAAGATGVDPDLAQIGGGRGIGNEAEKMVGGRPVARIGREQQRGVATNRNEAGGHAFQTRAPRNCSTNPATPAKIAFPKSDRLLVLRPRKPACFRSMSVLIVGSTALDSIKTPKAGNSRLLGGSASHAAVAASFFAPVSLVGVVGEDFPRKYTSLYRRHGLDLRGLQIKPGKTFHWSGEYEANLNRRRTLATELGVFDSFLPELPESHRALPFALLANIAPALQHRVLDQMRRPRFVAADTMDLWLDIARDDLLRLLKRVDLFVLNDSEARQLVNEDNIVAALPKIRRLGPKYVIIKKGEHGSILSGPNELFLAPAYPLGKVVDPTGAGDSFAGGLMGYLAGSKGPIETNLRRAMLYGSVTASFCCEGFGLTRTTRVTRAEIEKRAKELLRLTSVASD